jgi:predicted kinase
VQKNTLIVCVGLPRSGKSTWARAQGWPIVNPDSIRLAIHGRRFEERLEPLVWLAAGWMVRALFLAGHETVIVDGTHTTRKRRDAWLSPEWDLYFKPVPTSRQACLERALLANDGEIVPVIERMAANFEDLAQDERVWTAT